MGPGAAFDLQHAGVFQVALRPNTTASATMFEEVIDSVIASIKSNGVTEPEVRRWVASYRLATLSELQTVTAIAPDIGDAVINAKNPLAFLDFVDQAQRVTPAQVQAAAVKYLTGDRVVVSIIPTGKFDLISKPNLPYVNATPK
jgi:zinc protease